jgi:hypothetical protein
VNETPILITLLWVYIPRNWEFGSALAKLRNCCEEGVPTPPTPRGMLLTSTLDDVARAALRRSAGAESSLDSPHPKWVRNFESAVLSACDTNSCHCAVCHVLRVTESTQFGELQHVGTHGQLPSPAHTAMFITLAHFVTLLGAATAIARAYDVDCDLLLSFCMLLLKHGTPSHTPCYTFRFNRIISRHLQH